MQASHPMQSLIRLHLGEKYKFDSGVDLDLTLEFFSNQQQGIKNELKNRYKTAIPQTCFAFQFVVNGSASETAQLLAKISLNDIQKKYLATFHYNQHKILCILQVPGYAEFISTKEQYFVKLKAQEPDQNQTISLKISSQNDLKAIIVKQKEYGRLAWLQNMTLQFEFIKTELISRLFIMILEQMLDIDSFSSMLSSFTKINVELNFASGAYLLEFPKARIGDFLAGKTYLKSEIMSILESSAAEKVIIYGFNPIFFLKGSLTTKRFKQHLQFAFK